MSRKRKQARTRGASRRDGVPLGLFESSRLRVALVVVVALKIVGLVLIFDPATAQAFEGPKSAFSLATTWISAALIALLLLRHGLGVLGRTRLHVVVGVFAFANLVSVAFAQDPYVAVFGAQRHLGLTFVFDMVILYFAVALAYRSRRDWLTLASAVACAGLVAITYALVQYAGLDPTPWADDVRQRPPSTFGNPDKFGHFLGVTFITAAGVAMLPSDSCARRVRLLAGAYAVVTLGTAALVATRGTLVGIAVALPALGLIYLRIARSQFGAREMIGAATAALALAIVAGALLLASPLGDRVRGGFADPGTRQRLFVADAAIRAFVDRPLTGHGPDNFGAIYPRYRPPGSVAEAGGVVSQDSAHSWLLQSMATTGALGTLSLAAVALATFLVLWRAIGASPYVAIPLLAAAVAFWAQAFVAIGSVSVDWMGWLAAGGAASLSHRPVDHAARRVAPVLVVVIIGSAVALLISGLSALQADRELQVARVARQAGRPDRAIPPAERAVRLDPGRAEHWFALGIARQDRQEWPAAVDAFRGATERAPHVAAYWSNLALSLANLARSGDRSLGGTEAALAAARRGTEADPHSPLPHQVLAVVANGLGEHATALESSATAIRLFKGDPEYEAVAADAALRLSDALAARSALELLVREKDVPVLRVALARISLKLNDPDAARTQVRRALEIDPQHAAAREIALQLGVLGR